ncbi:hypothetical protein AJ80_04449 [Polytolypa hystricis UAMH7299]|uniref:C2H2-type domain-containing protein n=1 Tax=Polytolypa hystricis (strain UAMH7299) TaxID=1447883 RepID=A0A2B7YBL0_POLH7|nr:hypothetical protein AJ80_04449 [Polytolypa hystricis UAMH7299]
MSSMTSSAPVDNSSHSFAAFRTQNFDDPFLTHPSGGLDDQLLAAGAGADHDLAADHFNHHHHQQALDEQSTYASKGYPVADPAETSNDSLLHPTCTYHSGNQISPASHPEFFTPSDYAENGHSDLSSFTSPGIDTPFFLEAEFGPIPEFDNQGPSSAPSQDLQPQQQLLPETNNDKLGGNAESLPGALTTNTSSQLLSPVLTNTPSPPEQAQHAVEVDMFDRQNTDYRPTRRDTPARRDQYRPTLMTSPDSGSLSVNSASQPEQHPPSPIVRVSTFTRGDSPSRADNVLGPNSAKRGRSGLSATHLAPEIDDDYDYDDDEDDDYAAPVYTHVRSISVPVATLRANDGSWLPHGVTGQRGLDPMSRDNGYSLSPNEILERQKLDEKNADVEQWLSRSEASSEVEDNTSRFRSHRRKISVKNRRRAKSTGDPAYGRGNVYNHIDDSKIPGPGVLLHEDSGPDDDDGDDEGDDDHSSTTSVDVPESPPAAVNVNSAVSSTEYFPPFEEPEQEPENLEPLPRQFIRARPWQDQLRNPNFGGMKHQPENSNAAMVRFMRRAQNIETASRKATWGTRGLSDSEVDSVIGPGGTFESLRLGRTRKSDKPDRRNSFLDHASKFIHKRSNSTAKRKLSEAAKQQSSTESVDKVKPSEPRDSTSSLLPTPTRKLSFTRSPKSPLNTGDAVLAMTGQIAAVGGGGPVRVSSPVSGPSPWSHFRRRSRSRSDLPKTSKNGGLLELMTNFGGPPVPTLASPLQDKALMPSAESPKAAHHDDDDDDDEEDEVVGDKGIIMDFPVRLDPIVPTFEGFKAHILQLNPRLQPALVDRIASEQIRRYKKLVENKVKHAIAVSKGSCASAGHCFAQGGEAKMLPPRISAKDPESTYAQFQIPGVGGSDEYLSNFADGTVTAALFPAGVPLPPVRRLPAEFECSLCFKVKKFHKPSDWTKHVHEDVQPFTCTFPNCTEPKSFKRKADWVRHESERHRQLEWWTCNMADCSHTCYRKDNFVQHLVREHKMPEPKVKTGKSRGSNSSKAASNAGRQGHDEQAVEQVWQLVEECRHVTNKQPKDEACRFCGNICNSWKKLTVHMAKHMEQIALPVLELARQRVVSPDTVISPVERVNPAQQSQYNSSNNSNMISPMNQQLGGVVGAGPAAMSPYSTAAALSMPQNVTSAAMGQQQPMLSASPPDLGSYAFADPPLLSGNLQMHNPLGFMVPGPNRRAGLSPEAAASTYAVQSAYSQSNSPSLRANGVYPNAPQAPQQQFGPQISAATYPPPFNALRGQQDVTVSMSNTTQAAVQPSTPFNLTIPSVPQQATTYDSQPQVYASPVENLTFMYGGAASTTGQQAGAVNNQPTGGYTYPPAPDVGMGGYSMATTSNNTNGEAVGQGSNGYMHAHGVGQYQQYQNQ